MSQTPRDKIIAELNKKTDKVNSAQEPREVTSHGASLDQYVTSLRDTSQTGSLPLRRVLAKQYRLKL